MRDEVQTKVAAKAVASYNNFGEKSYDNNKTKRKQKLY